MTDPVDAHRERLHEMCAKLKSEALKVLSSLDCAAREETHHLMEMSDEGVFEACDFLHTIRTELEEASAEVSALQASHYAVTYVTPNRIREEASNERA